MSASTYFVSEAAVRNLKQRAERRVSGVRSAHMSEVVAAALGFRTHAALRAALGGRATAEASKPSNARAIQRLRQLGYNAPDDLHLLPELDRSYSPFKTYPLRKQRGVRWNAWRNLMVCAVNAALEHKLFTMRPGDDRFDDNMREGHLFDFVLPSGLPARGSVATAGFDELAVHAAVNPKGDRLREHGAGFAAGDVFGTTWLERRVGAWLQSTPEGFRCRKPFLAELANLEVKPQGFGDRGKLIM